MSCRHYLRAVCCRPASQYVVALSAFLYVGGWVAFLWGASYAGHTHDPVRYGAIEWFVPFLMSLAFVGLLGMGELDKDPLAFMDSERRVTEHAWRIVWIALWGMGGGMLGIGTAFYRWFDYQATTPAPSVTPSAGHWPWNPSPTTATSTPEPLGQHGFTPAYLLIMCVVCIWAALAFAWVGVVFERQEEKMRKNQEDGLVSADEDA
jgi:hypothetical protein